MVLRGSDIFGVIARKFRLKHGDFCEVLDNTGAIAAKVHYNAGDDTARITYAKGTTSVQNSLFVANGASGLANANGYKLYFTFNNELMPSHTNQITLGAPSYQFKNLYSNIANVSAFKSVFSAARCNVHSWSDDLTTYGTIVKSGYAGIERITSGYRYYSATLPESAENGDYAIYTLNNTFTMPYYFVTKILDYYCDSDENIVFFGSYNNTTPSTGIAIVGDYYNLTINGTDMGSVATPYYNDLIVLKFTSSAVYYTIFRCNTDGTISQIAYSGGGIDSITNYPLGFGIHTISNQTGAKAINIEWFGVNPA